MKKILSVFVMMMLITACSGKDKGPSDETKMMGDEEVKMEVKIGENPKVGGAAMSPLMNIVENAINSTIHTTLVAAVKSAELVETLSGPGPYTVFAPTDEAFAKLEAGTVDNLLLPDNRSVLTKILTYHVIGGKMSAKDLMGMNGQTLSTVAGDTLLVIVNGESITLQDSKGGMSTVTIADVNQSNGVIHVVDTVLMPN
jgi:uncharacterized surface protein with fasciclin (FAS1) repeats